MNQTNILLSTVTGIALWFIIVYILTMKRLVTDADADRKHSQYINQNYTPFDGISYAKIVQRTKLTSKLDNTMSDAVDIYIYVYIYSCWIPLVFIYVVKYRY